MNAKVAPLNQYGSIVVSTGFFRDDNNKPRAGSTRIFDNELGNQRVIILTRFEAIALRDFLKEVYD